MCGIAGIAGTLSEKNLIPHMLDIMKHRGPDSQGFYSSDRVHLGHCRLSINDLSDSGNQPFVSSDRTIAVAVNGEIYNYRDLKIPLENKGHSFRSTSDCEVVLHAYIDCGLNFIHELNGMFGICIWDGRKKELYLIRDRLGIKPLYYTITGETFLFASEIKALAQCDDVDLSTDLQSFAEYLAYENYFSNRTLNKHIKMVEPCEIVKYTVHDNSIVRKYFWQPDLSISKHYNNGKVYNKYIEVLEASVNRHLLSDVPVGSYLSSGIDSSTVVYWSSKKLGSRLKTYTGYFGMSGFYDEARAAVNIAGEFGCPNQRVEIGPEDFTDNIEKILWHLDEPKVGMGSFSQYMVAKRASKEVKVILTGHGGDEFFAGYPVFKAIFGRHDIKKLIINSSLRELMFAVYFILFPKIKKEVGYFLPNIFSLKSFQDVLNKEYYNHLIMCTDIFKELEILKQTVSNEYQRLILTYIKYYLPSLFIVEDKISMAFSLESRTPLCDNEMLDFALSVPLSQKLSGYELKHIPRKAMKGKLPDFIYRLPKRGFPTPLKIWFKKELRNYIKDFIFSQTDVIDMFNRKKVEKIVTSYQKSSIPTPYDEIHAHKIWIIINLILYFRNQKQRYMTGSC